MNVNTPEKIYIACDVVTEEGRAFILEHPVSYLKSVEYTRTDAFIEKACEYLRIHRDEVETEDNGISGWIPDYFIEDFKNYMKGE